MRNQLLYAPKHDIPSVSSSPIDFVKRKHSQVHILICLFLSIDQNPKQNFAQQCLDAFLKIIDKLPKEINKDGNFA